MTPLRIAFALMLLFAPVMAVAQTLDIHSPGKLRNNDGTGLANRTDFAPGIGIAFLDDPTTLRSQVNESGGGAVGGDQCVVTNYIDVDGGAFDWWDTYCERRGKERTSLCQRKRIHQGLDIVGGTPQTCRQNVTDGRNGLSAVDNVRVYAVADGEIGEIGKFTVRLNTVHGLFRYMHLNMAQLAVTTGQVINKGDFIGFMSRDFGGAATTYHLHLELWKNLGQGNVPVPLYFTYALAQARHTSLPIRIVDTGEVIAPDTGSETAEIDLTPMISSFWTSDAGSFGLIASRDERVLVNLDDADAVGDERVTLIDARKEDSDSGSHYIGELAHESGDCGQLRVPVTGPVTGNGLSLRLAAYVPSGAGCGAADWSLREFGFEFERANSNFVPSSVDLNIARSRPIGVPGVMTHDQPDLVRVSKSEITRNWSAITPQSPFPAWPEYLRTWPGLDRSTPIIDSAGHEIPAFSTDPAGVGIWWFWVHKRAGGSGVPDPSSVSFSELSTGMAGVDDITHPAASRYLNQYIALSAIYSNQQIDEITRFDLSDRDARWIVARTMYHHESGRRVELPQATFEAGVRLGQDVLKGTFTTLSDYR